MEEVETTTRIERNETRTAGFVSLQIETTIHVGQGEKRDKLLDETSKLFTDIVNKIRTEKENN